MSAALLPCAALLGVFAMVAVDHDTFEIHSFIQVLEKFVHLTLGVEMGFLKSARILTQNIPMHRAHNGHLGNVSHMLWHDLERK